MMPMRQGAGLSSFPATFSPDKGIVEGRNGIQTKHSEAPSKLK